MKTKDQPAMNARKERKQQVKRAWENAHREQVRMYGRAFYQRNKERRKAYSREYNRLHREERREYSKMYYRRKREEYNKYLNGNKSAAITKSQKYFIEHKHEIYKYRIYDYTLHSISQIRTDMPMRVEKLLRQYPFETYEKAIRISICAHGIYPSQGVYDDCYEAAMLAYLYSIHRCAKMGYDHVVTYIRKMINIYIVGAIVVYNDTKNFCEFNHFQEIRIDAQNSRI